MAPLKGFCDGIIKHCPGCQIDKPVSEFHLSGQTKDGFQTRCITCRLRYGKKRQGKQQRIAQRKFKYGMDFVDVLQMLQQQDNKCPGCNKALTEETCHVDHDHATDTNRSLMCQGCNKAIGFAYENSETLRRLAAYVDKHHS